jgi:BAH domain-containing protein
MINACWYYHPEQTVHRFDKHFYEHEVAKSGQYRDHPIESVIEKCFVMFHTRFFKGRPRGFPPNKSVYVCESRYNEDQRCFRKIKTWASCVPDEVRSKDYEMDLFPVPLSNAKVPSPIKHLVRSDATETSELPKPTWGDKHSPPIVGAAHRRPRDPKVSISRGFASDCVCFVFMLFAPLFRLCLGCLGVPSLRDGQGARPMLLRYRTEIRPCLLPNQAIAVCLFVAAPVVQGDLA